MVKIDLITGFLGSGKTTFLKKYAARLLEQGCSLGILENDYGAVNVDMMLLQELMGDQCELEMISGGCDRETHRRRFRTKLIAMGMCGYDRVLVEPSGIYDMDEFFDVLHEEPLDRWYEIGNVIALVDAGLEENISLEAEYLLASQAANAGCVVLSKCDAASAEEQQSTVAHLNRALEQIGCKRRFEETEILRLHAGELAETDFHKIVSCGYVNAVYKKPDLTGEQGFESLYFMDVHMSEEVLRDTVKKLMQDETAGHIFRVKGFMPCGDGTWMELNATHKELTLHPAANGQEILIVIGEHLVEEVIKKYWEMKI